MRKITKIIPNRHIAPFPLTKGNLNGARLKRKFRFARGGEGELFVPTRLAHTVAVKASKRGDSESRGKVIHEAEVLSSMHHKNIIHCYGHWEEGDRAFLVLEYIDGENLYRHLVLDSSFRFPLREALMITKKVVHALAYMHEKKLVHADVKLENIIVGGNKKDPRVKLVDFAIARKRNCWLPGEEGGRYFGTKGYVSSTRQFGEAPIEKDDLFSLGVVLKQMLLGIDSEDRQGGLEQIRELGGRVERTDLPYKVKILLYKLTNSYPSRGHIAAPSDFQNAIDLLLYMNRMFPEIA
jgi:serine/threonine protein kinase